MAKDFSFSLDIKKFINDLNATADDISKGAKSGLDEVKDDWVRRSRDIAPLNKGNLRRQIDGKVIGGDTVIVTGNAAENSKGYGRFNYGYWLHEKAPSSTNLTTPGTKLKFLDDVSKGSESKWYRRIEENIEDEIKKGGW
jgi:hypothetical protein